MAALLLADTAPAMAVQGAKRGQKKGRYETAHLSLIPVFPVIVLMNRVPRYPRPSSVTARAVPLAQFDLIHFQDESNGGKNCRILLPLNSFRQNTNGISELIKSVVFTYGYALTNQPKPTVQVSERLHQFRIISQSPTLESTRRNPDNRRAPTKKPI
jgi:hypothetical protein